MTSTTTDVARHAPALGLLALALGHLVAVHLAGVGRWRGGGMGMYTEIHWRKVWVVADHLGARTPVDLPRCQKVPTEACLRDALPIHPTADALEVWQPRFDAHTRTFRRERVARAER